MKTIVRILTLALCILCWLQSNEIGKLRGINNLNEQRINVAHLCEEALNSCTAMRSDPVFHDTPYMTRPSYMWVETQTIGGVPYHQECPKGRKCI